MSQPKDDAQKQYSPSALVALLKRALCADGDELKHILTEPCAEVLHAALKNISLTEEHLLHLLHRHDISSDLLRAITKHKLCQNHRIAMATVKHPALSPALAKQLLQQLHLFELLNLCTLPGQTADLKAAAEHSIIQRLPTEPLGNKITMARRSHAPLLLSLIKEGQPQIIDASLDNPHLTESILFQFLTMGNSSAQTISAIARHPRWQKRRNLQLAILKNRNTPQVWYINFLPKIPLMEARNLLHSTQLCQQQKGWIGEYLDSRGMR